MTRRVSDWWGRRARRWAAPRVVATAAVAWALLASNVTIAAADDSVASQKFSAGSRASERHDWSGAEALFEESIRLSPSVGAYFNRGYCLEQLGRTREAFRDYREAERLAVLRDDARGKAAHDAAARLLTTLHYVELDVPIEVARFPGLRVVVDGAEISEAQRRETLLSDSATHSVSVSAPGRTTWTRSGIADRTRITIELGSPPLANAEPDPHASASTRWGTSKMVALGAVGTGALTFGVSAVVFLRGAAHIDGLNDSNKRECMGAAMQSSTCQSDAMNAHGYRSDIAVATTVLDITGAVFIIAGATLWFAWPKGSAAAVGALRPQVGIHHAGLTWSAPLP